MKTPSNYSSAERKEFEHGLFGVGTVKYILNPSISELAIYIDGDLHRIYKDKKAIDIYDKATGDIDVAELLTFDNYKYIACEVCGVSNPRNLSTTKRDDKLVFARNFCFWIARKKLGMSYADTGSLFNRDHATAYRAVYLIENGKDKKGNILKPHQLQWKTSFIKRITAIENKLK